MTNTLKFSQFTTATLSNMTNKLVGAGGGVNIITDFPTVWTTATRPTPPFAGLLGYNSDLLTYEFYNGTVWIDLTGSGAGTVTQINTGLGLTGGPITTTGTISFGPMTGNTFWGNILAGVAVPTEVPTSYFVKTSDIGVTVEAWSPALDSIAALVTSANEIPYLTGSNTYSVMAASPNSVLVTSAGSVPSLSTTLPSAVQSNITHLGAQSSALNMNSHQINNVTDPTNPQDAATMAYVTAQTTGTFLPLIGGTMSGIINMGNHKITNLTDPSSAQDAVTINYLNAQLANYLSLSGGTMTGAINMGSHYITNLLDPVNPQDAATKNYTDSIAAGLSIQPAVYAATTANLTATYAPGAAGIGATLTNSGALTAFTTDGTTPPTNARILVWQQTSTLENGIYTLTNPGSGAVAWILTRATDYDQPAEIQPGDLVVVNNGTAYGGASFIETASVSVVGTDPILFSQFTFSATAVLLKANNLSDVANKTTSFNNISPLTTKGDLIGYDGSDNVRLAVGMTNGQILQVSSGAATGLAWSTATYPVTTTANQILFSSATNTVTGLSSIAGGVLVTDASSVPSFLTNPGVAGKILQSANAAIPTWSTPTYPSASGTLGKFLISDGTNNVYSTSTIPTSAGSTANKVLLSDGTNYVLSTPTFPNASATLRKIIISDGTNWIASTETYAAPGTSGNVMTSDGTNWTSAAPVNTGTVNSGLQNQLAYYAANGTTLSGLTTANNGVLVTSAGGVPSISSTLPSGLTIPGYAASGANSDITSMTGLTGTLRAPTGITSSAGLNLLTFGYTASAVNYFSIVNSATGSPVQITATGSDSVVTFGMYAKGGVFHIADSAASVVSSLRFYTNGNANFVSLSAPSGLATNPAFTLPSADGSNHSFLQTNGSGVLSFTSAPTGTGIPVLQTSPSLITPTLGVASATSINFGDTALANYKEGTWTPVIALTGGAGNTVPTYTTQATGRYTRIGNQAFCTVIFANSSGGTAGAGTGSMSITLPFTANANENASVYYPIGTAFNNTSFFELYGTIGSGATTMNIGKFISASSITAFTGADQNNASRFIQLKFFFEI